MSSDSLQERILRACYEFINADENRYKQERNEDFYKAFGDFVRKSSFENLLRRGSSENLKQQWQ